MTQPRPRAVRRLVTGLRERRQRRRARWVEKQASKRPGSIYSEYWKSGDGGPHSGM